jgi:hypothetical protein
MNDELLQASIDACRPGEGDLTRPEFSELANRLERDAAALRCFKAVEEFDGVLRSALDDVPVPAGLADRLLVAMPAVNGETESASPPVSLPARRARSWADTYEWFAPLSVVVLFAAVIGIATYSPVPPDLSIDDLVARSDAWQEQLEQQHEQWNERLKDAPRNNFPLSSQVALAPWRWQQLPSEGAEVVAYYEGPPGAILFVTRLKSKVANLTNSPRLLRATGGWSVAAWSSGDLTYVLVVEGDKRRYESHLKTQVAA